jgi:hypothetical protein
LSKKITFTARYPELDILKPFSSSRFVPDWYRKMKGVDEQIITVKKCVPFLDALTSGYMIPLPMDVTWDSERKDFNSDGKIMVNSDHAAVQTHEVVLPTGFNPQPHKWINSWHIKTPKGYSTLFIHPLNRLDLPFYSFSGVVDTDRHPLIINFPFVLQEGFEGTIPAGTPVIQAIPFKRDEWDSTVLDTGEPHSYPFEYEVMNPPYAWYKRKWWVRKLYR